MWVVLLYVSSYEQEQSAPSICSEKYDSATTDRQIP